MPVEPKPVDTETQATTERAGRDIFVGAPDFSVTAEPYRCPALEPHWHRQDAQPAE